MRTHAVIILIIATAGEKAITDTECKSPTNYQLDL